MISWPSWSLPVLALSGMIGTAIALMLDAHDALAAWLAAAIAVSAVSVGALAVLMITYLVRGTWTNDLHVPLTAASLVIPIAGLMFLPVILGLPWLYPWAHGRPGGAFKAVYLTPWFFILRSSLYFAVW